VGRGEAVRDLPHDLRSLAVVETALAADPLGERFALDILHHQPLLVLVLDEVEDGHDVGVIELRCQPGFALDPGEVGAGRAREHADALDRDVTAEHLVAREVDGAHAAVPDLAPEGVPACDQRGAFPLGSTQMLGAGSIWRARPPALSVDPHRKDPRVYPERSRRTRMAWPRCREPT
jgi:hypothetical protein